MTNSYSPLGDAFGRIIASAFANRASDCDAAPATNLFEDNGEYTLEVDLPGVKKSDISIGVNQGLLTIAAVRKRGEDETKYERKFKISDEIDVSSIQAKHEDGVLTLDIKKKAEKQPIAIQIQ